jgi:CBS domain-containing protein
MLNDEVRKIMTKDPIVATPDQTVGDVSRIMLEQQLQQLPVVSDGKLLGMVTAYDLWKSMLNGSNNDSLKVRDVMNTKVVKITPLDKVGTAAELFADRRFKTLPVVNLNNELKGVVTAFDVIKHVFKGEYPSPILYEEVFRD